MKDIKHCSISNIAFTLEIDAYDTLLNYLESIRSRYVGSPDGQEIADDIEARIAELILSVHTADKVVSKPLIDNIIAQMGSVDDICEPTEEPSSQSSSEESNQKSHRRLYRNIDDAPIGGVCSGIAAYIGCNTAIVRLIALLLVFFGGASFWIYIILWAIMPAAITASQKLEMRGEPVTASTINEFYNSHFSAGGKTHSIIGSILIFIGQVLLFLLKAMMILIMVGLSIALAGALVAIFTLFVVGGWGMYETNDIIVAIVTLLAVVTLFGLGVYIISQMIRSRQIKGRVVLVIVITGLFLSTITTCGSILLRDKIQAKIETTNLNIR